MPGLAKSGTTDSPPEFVRKDEIEFIEDAVRPKVDDLVLISIDDKDDAEKALIECLQIDRNGSPFMPR